MHSTLLTDEMPSAVPMFLKFDMDVMVRTLNGGLLVATKGVVFTGKCNTMEEHMDFGLYALLAARPRVTYQIN